MKSHVCRFWAVCCVVCFLSGCTGHRRIQEIQARISSSGMRQSDRLHCRFVPIDRIPSEEEIESFAIDDKKTIRLLAESLSVTSIVRAQVEEIPCFFHVEIAWDDNKGFWFLGGDGLIVFYDDFSLDRSFPPGYTMAKTGPEFWQVLETHCGINSRMHSWLDKMDEMDELASERSLAE